MAVLGTVDVLGGIPDKELTTTDCTLEYGRAPQESTLLLFFFLPHIPAIGILFSWMMWMMTTELDVCTRKGLSQRLPDVLQDAAEPPTWRCFMVFGRFFMMYSGAVSLGIGLSIGYRIIDTI